MRTKAKKSVWSMLIETMTDPEVFDLIDPDYNEDESEEEVELDEDGYETEPLRDGSTIDHLVAYLERTPTCSTLAMLSTDFLDDDIGGDELIEGVFIQSNLVADLVEALETEDAMFYESLENGSEVYSEWSRLSRAVR